MRFFNTTGPVIADRHYCIPPLGRVNVDEVLGLVRDWKYCTLHAPRQSGKTSVLLALQALLNSGKHGDYRCVYVNVDEPVRDQESDADPLLTALGVSCAWSPPRAACASSRRA